MFHDTPRLDFLAQTQPFPSAATSSAKHDSQTVCGTWRLIVAATDHHLPFPTIAYQAAFTWTTSYRRLARVLLNEPALNADFIKQRDFLQFSDREHAVLRHRGAPPLVSLYIVHSGIFPYLSPLQVSTFRGSRQLSGLLSPEEILSL